MGPKAGEVQITIVVRSGDAEPEKDRCAHAQVTLPKADLEGVSSRDIAIRYLEPGFVSAFNAVKNDA